jgi:hypothetical protein
VDHYNFWQDFFDTYQSLSDWMKFAWLVVPPAFALGLAALAMRFKIESKRAELGGTGKLIYSIHRDDEGQFHIVSHAPQIDEQPTLLLLDPPNRDPHAAQNPARHM